LGALAVTKIAMDAPKVAEAMTALEAVLFCKEIRFLEVLLEGDAKQVVTKVNAASPNLSAAGQFLTGIQEELQGLKHATMVYVGR
jgi:ribonuclease HI